MTIDNFTLILISVIILLIYAINSFSKYLEIKRKKEAENLKLELNNYEKRVITNLKFDILFILIATKLARGDFDTKKTSVNQDVSKAKADKK